MSATMPQPGEKNADILYVLHRDEPSETFIRREVAALRDAGHEVTVLHLCPAAPLPAAPPELRRAAWRALFVRLSAPPFSPTYAMRLARSLPHAARLADAARRCGAAHLHAQFAWTAADACALAAVMLGLRWSCGVHAWDVFTRPRHETRARLATATGITACTQRAINALLAARVEPRLMRLVRHGLAAPSLPFSLPRPAGSILAIGRLVPKKGFDTLLRACAELRRKGRDFGCTIAGDGPEAGRLRGLARQLNISDAVKWTGWLTPDAAQRAIAAATILAHPSRRLANADADGFANVLSEAMFLGTPIITTDAGAAGELLHDNANALIVPPDDAPALALALETLLTNPPVRQRLALAARTTAEQHLDQRITTRQLCDFFTLAGA